jgi:peroxiredoxin Q/BCP
MYGKKYYGIIRSHFVIDEQGRIADVQYNISPEESVESALAALRLG